MSTQSSRPQASPDSMDPIQDWNSCLSKIGADKNRAEFSKLFTHFAPRIKSFLLRNPQLSSETAEEIVQETMIKIWQKSSGFKSDTASATTWIYTLARNTRIDSFRKQKRQDNSRLRAEDIYQPDDEDTLYGTLFKLRRNELLKSHVLALPTEQSEVLHMMYAQGLSGRQVAEALELPIGTVKSRIRLAMAKLKIGISQADVSEQTQDKT